MTAAEYWNSESEDGTSYIDMINDLLLPSTDAHTTTIGAEFRKLEGETVTSTNDNFNQAFDTSSHSNSPSGLQVVASAYNSDFMDTSDQSYQYANMDYLTSFNFNPTTATAPSSQHEDLFLPPSTQIIDPFHSDSPNSALEVGIRVPHNLNKRLRISDFTEENILPDNERRKRSKPERLIL